ncbi:hypothetical protein DYB32_007032 [Aphanomyces invadans]|uniref:Autophagy protein ATG5 UblB domain-containing protein n=1 Tax=Aphanomyces invadans TaxID=157072 RepID=A0A418APM2_9STRA|nr:hypothetical protein DYB32_007032 [Aphanomyces invadans]
MWRVPFLSLPHAVPGQLLPCDNLQAVEMHFMNCYKQTIRSALVYLLPQVDIDAAAVRVHGIDVELDLSISELYRHFAYPDGFLYIAVLA